MSFSDSNNFIIVVTVFVPRVCVPVRSFFCRHVHLEPDVRVHRGTEHSFIYYNRDFFAENASLGSYGSITTNYIASPEPQNTDNNGIHATRA